MLNNIKINGLYRFEFIDKFNIFNGIYRIMSVLNYEDVLNNNIDIKESIYDVAQATDVEFENDFAEFDYLNFYKLVRIDTPEEVIVHMPEKLIKGEPEFSLVAVKSVGISFNLDFWLSKEQVELFASEMQALLEARLGIIKQPVLWDIGTGFITEQEYEILKASREAIKTQSKSVFKVNQDLLDTISKQNVKIAALEDIIKNI